MIRRRRHSAFANQDDRRWQLSGAPVDGRQPVAPGAARCRDGRSQGAGAGGPGPGDRRGARSVRSQSSRGQRDGRLLHLAAGRHPETAISGRLRSLATGSLAGKVVLGEELGGERPSQGQRIAVGQQKNIRPLNVYLDSDDVVRRIPLTFPGGEKGVASMALELASRALNAEPVQAEDGSVTLAGYHIPGLVPNTLTLNFDEYGSKLSATLKDGVLDGEYSRGTRGAQPGSAGAATLPRMDSLVAHDTQQEAQGSCSVPSSVCSGVWPGWWNRSKS